MQAIRDEITGPPITHPALSPAIHGGDGGGRGGGGGGVGGGEGFVAVGVIRWVWHARSLLITTQMYIFAEAVKAQVQMIMLQ